MKIGMSLFIAISVMASCGRDSDRNKESADALPEQPAFSLVGLAGSRWKSECRVLDDKKRSASESVAFAETTFEFTTSYFDGVECNPALSRVTYKSPYIKVVKDPRERVAGWSTFTYTVDAIWLSVHQEVLVRNYNQQVAFGYNDWVVDQQKDVAGKAYNASAEREPDKGSARERTLRSVENELFFASYANGYPEATDKYRFSRM